MADDEQRSFDDMPSTDELLDMIPRDDTDSGVEVSGDTPEPDHAEAPIEAESVTPAEGDDAPQPRNEDGTFAEKQKDTGAPTEGAAPGEAAPEPATPPAPTPDAVTPEQPVPEEFPEWSYRAYGQDYALPGSKHGEDGVFIGNEGLPALTQMLSRANAASRRETELNTRLQQAESSNSAELAQAQKIVDEFTELSELYKREGADGIVGWFEDLDRNWALIQARAENERLKASLDGTQGQLTERQQQEEVDALVPRLEGALRDAVAEVAGHEKYQGLDINRLFARLAQQMDRIFTIAPEDDPATGVQKGQVVFDSGPVYDEFEYAMSLKPPAQDTTKVTAMAAANKAATAEAKVPAVAPAGGGEAPSTEREIPKFKTKEETDRWLESGDWQRA